MKGYRMTAVLAVVVLLAACGGTDPADDAAGEIVLGAPTALGTVEGRASVQAAQLAVDEINEAGGVEVDGERHLMRLVEADTRGAEPDIPIPDALSSIERLITEHEPHAFVVSPFRSEVMLAAMDLVADEQVPMIASIAMTPEFQARIQEDPERFKYFFRTGLNAQFLAMYLTQLLDFIGQEHGLNRLMVIHQDVLWATGTAGFVTSWAEENGWEVVGEAAFPTGSSDFSSALATAQRDDADVILPLFDMPQSGALVSQVQGMGIDALVAGFNSPVAAENATDAFDAEELEGVVNFIFEIGPLPVDAVPGSVDFNRAFGEAYGEEARAGLPGHGPGPAYDSVYILKDAIERAGSLDPDAIAEALMDTDYEGVVGRVRFEGGNQAVYGMDPGEAALGAAFQWQNGERVPVFPPAIAEADVQVPTR
jgi:branched-chain amino acid transport system substrate-binding protein